MIIIIEFNQKMRAKLINKKINIMIRERHTKRDIHTPHRDG